MFRGVTALPVGLDSPRTLTHRDCCRPGVSPMGHEMLFDDPDVLRHAGFTGFESVAALRASRLASVSEEPGVYLAVRPALSAPRFLGRNPRLRASWARDACAIYIGKARGPGIRETLRKRLGRYLRQGSATPPGTQAGDGSGSLPTPGRCSSRGVASESRAQSSGS